MRISSCDKRNLIHKAKIELLLTALALALPVSQDSSNLLDYFCCFSNFLGRWFKTVNFFGFAIVKHTHCFLHSFVNVFVSNTHLFVRFSAIVPVNRALVKQAIQLAPHHTAYTGNPRNASSIALNDGA